MSGAMSTMTLRLLKRDYRVRKSWLVNWIPIQPHSETDLRKDCPHGSVLMLSELGNSPWSIKADATSRWDATLGTFSRTVIRTAVAIEERSLSMFLLTTQIYSLPSADVSINPTVGFVMALSDALVIGSDDVLSNMVLSALGKAFSLLTFPLDCTCHWIETLTIDEPRMFILRALVHWN